MDKKYSVEVRAMNTINKCHAGQNHMLEFRAYSLINQLKERKVSREQIEQEINQLVDDEQQLFRDFLNKWRNSI